MADNKYERYIQLFPRTFRPQDGDELINNLPADSTTGQSISELWNGNIQNPVLNAVLRGFAQGDLDVATALDATKASLFVRTAENQQLDVIASSLGVSRPGSLGLSDSAFQNLVPPLSLGAKQVRTAFYNAMDAFYGPEFSRANLISTNTTISTFDLQLDDSLSFIVDDGTTQTITVRATSGISNFGAATALELSNLLTTNLVGITSEILTDPITKIETVRIRTNTPGLRGAIQFSIIRPVGTAPSIFLTDKAELLKQPQRTVVYEITPNNVIIELPAVLPSLQRGLKGALHVHNGPLLNNLIFRGESTNFVLPDELFETPALEISVQANPGATIQAVAGQDISLSTGQTAQFEVGDEITLAGLNNRTLTTTITAKLNDNLTLGSTSGLIAGDVITHIKRQQSGSLYSITEFPTWFDPTTEFDQATRILTLDPPAGQDIGVYEFTVANSLSLTDTFKFFVRVDNRLSPSANTQIWEGAFIFDPSGSQTAFTVSGESAVILGDAITGADTLAAGRVFPRVNVDPSTNNLPDESGFAVVGFGSESQEPALIRYRGKASESIIELDPSFVFTQNQPPGTYINIVSSATPFIPDRVGGDYPIYLTSSTEARIVVQNILQSLAAAGVVVTFVVLAPEYVYLIDNPYLTTDDAPVV